MTARARSCVGTRRRAGARAALGCAAVLGCVAATAWGDSSTHGSEAFTEPYAEIDVAASEPGRLTSVLARRGAQVAAGELLMELDATVLSAARQVAAQRAAATARIEAARVDHQQKLRRLEAVTALRRTGAASQDELQAAETEMRIAELNVRAAEEDRDRARLELAEIEARLEQRRVRAPIAGIVVDLRHEAGEFVAAGDPTVATLVDLSRLRATFHLPTADAVRLREGQAVRLRELSDSAVPAGEIPPGDGTPVAPILGRIEHVAPLTQADSGRVRVDVVIDNPDGACRSGVRCALEASAP